MDNPSLWVALVGASAMVIAGVIAATAQLKSAYLTAKAEKDRQTLLEQSERSKSELEELRVFRQELKADLHRLEERLNTVTQELHTAQEQIIRQREIFGHILIHLERIVSISDSARIVAEIANLVKYVRDILNLPIGYPELRMKELQDE